MDYKERLARADSFVEGLVAGVNSGIGEADTLEALAARFERNAADWRQIRGQPDLNDVKGAGYAAGMAEAYMLAAADIRRTLRGDDPPGWDGAGADVEAQRG